jgi:nicotinamidase/pyrazinamidase
LQKLIFWDVDTQYDFMMPDGKLYVPGAETLVGNLSRLTAYARAHGIQICGSVDYHLLSDAEISDKPDFHETFPPHCLQGTTGQEKIAATKPAKPLWIENSRYDRGRLRELVTAHGGEILFRKQRFDVFSNPNVLDFLDIVEPAGIVVYGVALDVCDAHAIEGFLKLGSFKVFLVKDAAKAIYEDKGKELLEEWANRGVTLLDTSEVEEGIPLRDIDKAR